MIHYKTINLNVFLEAEDESWMPNPVELAVGLQEGLPKEWSDPGDGYSVRFVPTIGNSTNDELIKQIKMQKAQLVEKGRLVGHLEETQNKAIADRNRAEDSAIAYKNGNESLNRIIENLVEKNDNQSAIINSQQVEIGNQSESINNGLIKWTQMRDERDATRKLNSQQRIVMNETNAAVVRLKTDLRSCQKSNLNYIAERKVEEEMIAKIVDAMQGAGYDISGWGNDEQLTELEDAATQIENAGLKLSGKLDEIRTER